MTTTVYLVRHGRTALNAAGQLRGRIDAPLDEVGRSEAALLASLFAPVRLNQIITSPLKRTIETASAIAEPHSLEVNVDAAFVDRDYGPWAGRPREEVEARYGSLDDAPASEVEPKAEFERRVVAALETLVAHAAGRTVVVAGHDAVNRALIRGLCERYRSPSAELPQPTGCWNRLVFGGQDPVCEVVGARPGDGTEPGADATQTRR